MLDDTWPRCELLFLLTIYLCLCKALLNFIVIRVVIIIHPENFNIGNLTSSFTCRLLFLYDFIEN